MLDSTSNIMFGIAICFDQWEATMLSVFGVIKKEVCVWYSGYISFQFLAFQWLFYFFVI